MPSAPWAWAATKVPRFAASSTAARISCFGVLRLRRRRPGGEHGARRDHLDEVGAAREQLAHALAHFRLVVRDAAAHFVGYGDAFRQAGDFAAAIRDRDVGARDVHARSLDLACVDRVSKRDVDKGAVGAEVAHCRESRVERRARMRDAHQGIAGGGTRQRRRDVCGADVADEVRVQVDESRQHRELGPVDEPAAAARGRGPRRDRRDAPILDADRAVREIDALLHVEHAAGMNDDRFRARCCRERETHEYQQSRQRRAIEFHSAISLKKPRHHNCC